MYQIRTGEQAEGFRRRSNTLVLCFEWVYDRRVFSPLAWVQKPVSVRSYTGDQAIRRLDSESCWCNKKHRQLSRQTMTAKVL